MGIRLRQGPVPRYLLAALAALVLAAAAVAALAPERLVFRDHESLLVFVNQHLHPYRASAESSSLSLLEAPGRASLRLGGAVIRDSSGERVLSAESLSVEFGLSAALGGTPGLRAMRLDKPEAAVEGSVGQIWAWVSGESEGPLKFGLPLAAALGGADADVAVEEGMIRWQTEYGEWRLDGLRLEGDGSRRDGSFRLVDAGGGEAGTVEWRTRRREGGGTAASARIRDVPTDPWLGPSSGLVPGSRISVNLAAEIDAGGNLRLLGGGFRIGGGTLFGSGRELPYTDVSSSFRFEPENNVLSLDGFEVALPDLMVSGSLGLQFGPAGALVELGGSLATDGGGVEFEGEPMLALEPSSAWFVYQPLTESLEIRDLHLSTGAVRLDGGAFVDRGEEGLVSVQLEISEFAYTAMPEGAPSVVLSDVNGILEFDPRDRSLSSSGIGARFGDTFTVFDLEANEFGADLRNTEFLLGLSELTVEQVLEAWPEQMLPQARTWLAGNVLVGHLNPTVLVRDPGDEPEIDVEFGFTEASVRVAAGLPPLKHARGRALIRRDEARFRLERGVFVAGQGRVQLTEGAYDLNRRSGTYELRASLEGTAAATLSLAEGAFSSSAGFLPDSGEVAARIELAGDADGQAAASVADYSIRADVRGVGVPGGVLGIDLGDLEGELVFASDEARFSGKVSIGGLPATVAISRLDAGSYLVEAEAEVDDLALTRAGTSASGVLPLELRIESGAGAPTDFALKAGLDGIELRLAGRYPLPLAGELVAEGAVDGSEVVLESASLDSLGSELTLLDPLILQPNYALHLGGALSSEWIRRIASDNVGRVARSLPVRLQIRPADVADGVELSGWADLSSLELAVPEAGFRKSSGEAAEVEFDGRLSERGLRLGTLAISGNGFEALGALHLDSAGRLQEANFDTIRLGRRSQFSASARRIEEGGLKAWIEGNSLDMQDFAWLEFGDLAEDSLASGEASAGRLEIEVNLRRFHFNERIWMESVEGTVRVGEDGLADGFLSGRALGKSRARVVLSHTGGVGTRQLVAENAGELLGALNYASDMEGGTLTYTLQSGASESDGAAPAHLRIEDVYVYNTNFITKLISFISTFGFIEFILVGREFFSEVEMRIEELGDRIRIIDGYAQSNHVSLVFAGDFDIEAETVEISGVATPARFARRLLGEVPILNLLIPDEEDTTAIGVGFRMHGSTGDPEVELQPLKAIENRLPPAQQPAENAAPSRSSAPGP